jgi:hypothetical protein
VALKTVIVLEQNQANTFRYVLRATVPATRQSFYALRQATAVSAYQDTDAPTQASDQTALRAGQITEQVGEFSTNGRTLTQIEADLVTQQTAFQAQINTANPWVRYGSYYDGAAWTLTSIA